MKFSFLRFLFMANCVLFEGEGGGAFMGGGSAGGAGNEGGGEGGPQYAYPEGLDESFHGNPTLLKYANEDGSFNQANIMKSLIHATSNIGADKMAVPNQNFTDDQWKETFQKLGVPADISEYGVKNNLLEGQTANEEMFNAFTKLAHENGILPKQAQAISDFYNQNIQDQGTNTTEAYQQKVAQETVSLKAEWGEEGYDKNIKIAEQALKHFVTDEAELKAIVDAGFLDSSAVTKLFHKLGIGLQEDGFDHETTGTFGMDNAGLDEAITKIGGELTTMGKGHPNYQAKLKQYQDALNKRHGSNPVSGSASVRI